MFFKEKRVWRSGGLGKHVIYQPFLVIQNAHHSVKRSQRGEKKDLKGDGNKDSGMFCGKEAGLSFI